MNEPELKNLLSQLLANPENEVVEFKEATNNFDFSKIGKYFSALSNEANLRNKGRSWLVFGIRDSDHSILGTNYRGMSTERSLDSLKFEISQKTTNNISFNEIHQLITEGKRVILFEIPQAPLGIPTAFDGHYYGREGDSLLALSLEKIERIRKQATSFDFETSTALSDLSGSDVITLLDIDLFYRGLKRQQAVAPKEVLKDLIDNRLVNLVQDSLYEIPNLAAILYAKNLSSFPTISNRSFRVIQYAGVGRTNAIKEQEGQKGYAVGFEGLIGYINDLLPQNEVIEQALRRKMRVYPEIAIRELVANAIIHQDFTSGSSGPKIEIFSDRVEITNTGLPLVETKRFIDEESIVRNDKLAGYMRKLGICEERGSGIDKVIEAVESHQLPAPIFEVKSNHTKVTLFAPKKLNEMSKEDKVRACY